MNMSHEQVMDVLKPSGGDYVSMLVAFVAYFLVSFLWWGPLFGKRWGTLMGMDMNEKPSMAMPMLLQALGTLLLTYVLWHVMEAFNVTHAADGTGIVMGDLAVGNALAGAFYTWLGFFVPVQLGRVAWEKAPWALFGINAGGHLVALAAMSLAFAFV